MMETPYIDLNPDYQRDVVWTAERMTKLIDSLLGGFYIPPLIFNVHRVTSPVDGREHYMRIAIDGKQRMTSIREFVNGNIPCTDGNNRRWYYCQKKEEGEGEGEAKGKGEGGGGAERDAAASSSSISKSRRAKKTMTKKKNRRILPAKVRREFLRREILCAEFSDLKRAQQEDLFSRVQLGMPLTPAEKLRASSGKWQEFAIQLEKEHPELMQVGHVVDNRRGRGFQLILQVLRQLLRVDERDPTYAAGAGALKTFCQDARWLTDDLKRTARSVFGRYTEVCRRFPATFDDHGYSHAKKFSPVEFVAVAVLIHRFPDRNALLLSRDILELRRAIREDRQELRSNTQTWKSLMDGIVHIEMNRGAVDPSVLLPRRQPRINRTFGAAADGETGLGEAPSSPGRDISAQDASGRSASSRRCRAPAAASPLPASAPPAPAQPSVTSTIRTRSRASQPVPAPLVPPPPTPPSRRRRRRLGQEGGGPPRTGRGGFLPSLPSPSDSPNPNTPTATAPNAGMAPRTQGLSTTTTTTTAPFLLFGDLPWIRRDWSVDVPRATPEPMPPMSPAPPWQQPPQQQQQLIQHMQNQAPTAIWPPAPMPRPSPRRGAGSWSVSFAGATPLARASKRTLDEAGGGEAAAAGVDGGLDRNKRGRGLGGGCTVKRERIGPFEID